MPTKWALDHLCQAPPKTRSDILKCYPRFSFKLAILSCTQTPASGFSPILGTQISLPITWKKQLLTWSFFFKYVFPWGPGFCQLFRHALFCFPFWSGFGRVFQTNHPNHIALVIFFWWIDPELLETTSKALDAVAIAERYPKSTHHLKGREEGGGAF